MHATTAAPGRRDLLRLAAIVLLFTAAPTAGDIGSCGEEPADLDAAKFFHAKDEVDCARCTECETGSFACGRACDPTSAATCGSGGGGAGGGEACVAPGPGVFPPGCYPLVRDGEVCLNALRAASCDDYAGYMSDESPTIPTECNFCPARTP